MVREVLRPLGIVAMLVVAAAGAQTSAPTSPEAEAALTAAFEKFYIEGDVEVAIRDCERIVAAHGEKYPEAAARALVMAGDLHALSGDGESRRVYEQVLSEYGDQKQAAHEARIRLKNPGILVTWP